MFNKMMHFTYTELNQLVQFITSHPSCNKVGCTIEEILPQGFGVIYRVTCACGTTKDIMDMESW